MNKLGLDADLAVRLGPFTLDVALSVAPRSVTVVLGPNGAGKSTMLQCLSGAIGLAEGRIQLAGRVLDDPGQATFVPPERRRIALVHQDLLLFPHLSALDNIAFGPRQAGASRRVARQQATRWLARVDLADFADARPSTLSGGQAQRVALARALAVDPELLLLDEPFAALDVTTRAETRRDLRRHLDGFGGTTIVVTHDPLDALTLATGVVVLEAGRATQTGPLADVAARPRTAYVAELLGANLLAGHARGRDVQVGTATVEVAEPTAGPVFATFSPRAVALHLARPTTSARNLWPVEVTDVDLLGDRARVRLAGPVPLVAEVTPAAIAELALGPGATAWASVKATEIEVYAR